MSESSAGVELPSPVKCLASRVKRRRRRSSASGAGLQSILPMRGSGPAYLGFLGLRWFLVLDKWQLQNVLAGVLIMERPFQTVWAAGGPVGTAYRVVHP